DGCNGPTLTWSRAGDWVPGVATGSTTGNPVVDAMGRPVWFYDYVAGGPLGAPDAWYLQPGTSLVWDMSWFGSTARVWARADEPNPPIGQNDMTHTIGSVNVWTRIPRARWRNPLGVAIAVSIEGTFYLGWHGENDVAAPIDVELAIAHLDAQGAHV